jgi:AcrR family transcriptional regulator
MRQATITQKRIKHKVAFRSSAEARQRAISVATRILLEEGYSRLTMERVAAESGVAKTTLYRHWPTKAHLCRDLYLEVAGRELKDPATGDVATDLRCIAETVVRLQTRTVAGPALLGLIAEAQINPDTTFSFLAEFAQRRRTATRLVLQRAIERGQLRPETDPELVIDGIGGAITFRLLQRHAPTNRKFIEGLIELVLSGCRNTSRN